MKVCQIYFISKVIVGWYDWIFVCKDGARLSIQLPI